MNNQKIDLLFYVRNGFISIDSGESESSGADLAYITTVLCNVAYYGYTFSKEAIEKLHTLSNKDVINLWNTLEGVLKEITGDKYSVGDYVLYKNFPNEVLEMSTAEYWYKQFLVYLGADYEIVAQKEKERECLDLNELQPKVLHLANKKTKTDIKNNLVAMKNRWNNDQFNDIFSLREGFENIVLSDFGFKENGIKLMLSLVEDFRQFSDSNKLGSKFKSVGLKSLIKNPINNFVIKDATDVLRLASGIAGSDHSLRGNVSFHGLSKSERKSILRMLDESKNLQDDVVSRKALFRKLFRATHPGDFKFKRVKDVYNKLYNNKLKTSFNSKYEKMLEEGDDSIFDLLKSRKGFFLREFHSLYSRFGYKTVKEMIKVLDNIETIQLLKFKSYLITINSRETLVYPPKGDWSRVVFEKNEKIIIKESNELVESIDKVLSKRVLEKYKEGFDCEEALKKVKLQTNDQKLASYGRGTVFDIPENIKFIRTASCWNINRGSFLDNTWNFFDDNWNVVSTCCWNKHTDDADSMYSMGNLLKEDLERIGFSKSKAPLGAVFSGDSVNHKEGKASQLIDLYLDVLENKGVRYAVWSVLSYNNINFNDFNDAFAGMILGENPEKGNLFEPSRVKFAFSLKNEAVLSKIVAYVDIKERKIVYLDINKGLNIKSGTMNQNKLKECMPAILDYINSLPSVYDLFSTAGGKIKAVYSDNNINVEENEKVYSFLKENENIKTEQFININNII